jgi:outer membrane autotransporter protein
MNTYDCDLFDAKGVCVSVGGQQTYVDNPSSNMTSTVVVAGYKVSPNIRIGGFLNQNINNNTVSGVHISNANPMMGLFAVWNQKEDRLGYQVKIANAYQDKDVTTTRDVIDSSEAGIGASEAGIGRTNLNTQSYVGELSYAFLANKEKTLVRPYAALRYTSIKQDGYTEQTSAGVTAPLTYAALADRSTTALVGVKLNHKLAEKVNLTGSLGIEQDLHHQVDNLTATGIAGLTSENFNDSIKRTRPVASIGAYYMPVKNQRISADIYYQQLPFQSTGSATAYVNYSIGF